MGVDVCQRVLAYAEGSLFVERLPLGRGNALQQRRDRRPQRTVFAGQSAHGVHQSRGILGDLIDQTSGFLDIAHVILQG